MAKWCVLERWETTGVGVGGRFPAGLTWGGQWLSPTHITTALELAN